MVVVVAGQLMKVKRHAGVVYESAKKLLDAFRCHRAYSVSCEFHLEIQKRPTGNVDHGSHEGVIYGNVLHAETVYSGGIT